MKRILSMALMGGLLISCGARAAASAPAPAKALFCPECWEYLRGPEAMDLKGNCGVCGKYPVRFEAEWLSWWWCEGEQKWRRTRCNENPINRCCTQEEASAAVVAPGSGVLDRWFCPFHHAFAVYRLPILQRVVCRTCARPAVEVSAIERSWYWCDIDGVWGSDPCPMSPVKKCCSERKGLLLVAPDLGPIVNRGVGDEGRNRHLRRHDSD